MEVDCYTNTQFLNQQHKSFAGRRWKASELRIKSNEDLQKLWYLMKCCFKKEWKSLAKSNLMAPVQCTCISTCNYYLYKKPKKKIKFLL